MVDSASAKPRAKPSQHSVSELDMTDRVDSSHDFNLACNHVPARHRPPRRLTAGPGIPSILERPSTRASDVRFHALVAWAGWHGSAKPGNTIFSFNIGTRVVNDVTNGAR
jgi:hypothetical protein